MKVIYPGPGVQGALRSEAQLHPHLGHIQVGENEIQEGPELRSAIAAGLFEEPNVLATAAPGVTIPPGDGALVDPAAPAAAEPNLTALDEPAGDPPADDAARPARRRGARE